MYSKYLALASIVGVLACGGKSEVPDRTFQQAAAVKKIAACSLLSTDEVLAATGWASLTVDSSSGCNYRSPNENEVVSVMISSGLKPMGTSAEMAAWRSGQVDPDDDIKPIITVLDGFGVPAIRNEIEGTGFVTIEAGKNGYLVDVSAGSFDVAKKLTPTALSRVP